MSTVYTARAEIVEYGSRSITHFEHAATPALGAITGWAEVLVPGREVDATLHLVIETDDGVSLRARGRDGLLHWADTHPYPSAQWLCEHGIHDRDERSTENREHPVEAYCVRCETSLPLTGAPIPEYAATAFSQTA